MVPELKDFFLETFTVRNLQLRIFFCSLSRAMGWTGVTHFTK